MEFLVLLVLAVVVILVIHFRAQSRIKALESQVEERASSRYDEWRRRDVDRINAEQREVARREAQARMQEWQVTHEANIRADAINRSQAVITGKVSENVAPFMPLFPYNPKDGTGRYSAPYRGAVYHQMMRPGVLRAKRGVVM